MPLVTLPEYVVSLLAAFAPCFTAPGFVYFQRFVWSFMVAEGKKTTTLVCRLHAGWQHFTNFARFLRCYRWSVEGIAQQLVELLVPHLPWPRDEQGQLRLTVAIDDTLTAKTGKKLPAVAYHKDPNAGRGVGSFVRGHCWVALGLVFWVGRCTLCFPVRAALYRRRQDCEPGEFASKLQLAVELLRELEWPENAHLRVLADGAYAARDFLRDVLQMGHHVITRLRIDARVFDPPPARPPGRRGRPRKYGRRRSLKRMAREASRFRTVHMTLYGQRAKQIQLADALLVPWIVGRLCRIVVVKIPGRPVACLLSTDTELSAEQMVELYGRRFSLEITFRELKQRCGLGQYQVRSVQAIQRHVQLSLVACSLLHLARVELSGQQPGAEAVIDPWRRPAELLTLGQARRLLQRLSWQEWFYPMSPQATQRAQKHPLMRSVYLAQGKSA